MFEKIEVLDTVKHKNTSFDEVPYEEIGKYIGSIPLGFGEVLEMAPYCPIIISGKKEHLEFVAFTGLNSNISIFLNSLPYIPNYLKTYPFINAVLVDKKGSKKDVIGIAVSEFVGTKKQHPIFTKEKKLESLANQKIELIRTLNRQRDISKKIIHELEKYDLLQKRDFKVSFKEETRVVLEDFYIVDRVKLMQLDDAILALWAKKGWITLLDIHLKSINNFPKIIATAQ